MRPYQTILVVIAATAAITAFSFAHPPVSGVAAIGWTPEGHVTIHLNHDALAFALNDTSTRIADAPMYELLNGPTDELVAALADGRDRMATGLKLFADGIQVPIAITQAPTLDDFRRWKEENPAGKLPVRLEFLAEGTLPRAARTLAVRFPPVLGDVILTVQRPGAEPVAFPLRAEETSPDIEIAPPDIGKAPGAPNPPPLKPLSVARRYLALGFSHIVPDGPDHMLFVLGLFLLSPHVKTVLWQITAFTIAHTITLTLTALHIVGVPSSIVEPAIAASIAFIGIENLCTTQVRPWRIAVAFVFGLVHGMGVATAFNEAGFPPGQLVPSLAAFTVGVEAGHLAVLAIAFLVLGWWRNRKWFRRSITVPGSILIAAIALFWMFQRLA